MDAVVSAAVVSRRRRCCATASGATTPPTTGTCWASPTGRPWSRSGKTRSGRSAGGSIGSGALLGGALAGPAPQRGLRHRRVQRGRRGGRGPPVGVDADAEAIAICALKREKAGGAFVRAAAERLPFRDGAFDVVYCFSAIEHVESVEATVAEMVRVTRPRRPRLRAHPERLVVVRGPLQAPLGAVPARSRSARCTCGCAAVRARISRRYGGSHRGAAPRVRARGRARPALSRRRAAPRVGRASARADRALLPALRRLALHRAGGAQAMTSVLFASEYYPPFAPGGAEWSTAAWAAALARRGHRVTVVTPNYGAPRARGAGRGHRHPRAVSGEAAAGAGRGVLARASQPALPSLLRLADAPRRRARPAPQIIHAQGKAALVAGLRAGEPRAPVLATIRDVGLLCPLGHCTMFEKTWKTFDCTTTQYETKCVPYHLEHYHPGAGPLRARAAADLAAPGLARPAGALPGPCAGGRRHRGEPRHPRHLSGAARGGRRSGVVHTLPPAITAPSARRGGPRRDIASGSGPGLWCCTRASSRSARGRRCCSPRSPRSDARCPGRASRSRVRVRRRPRRAPDLHGSARCRSGSLRALRAPPTWSWCRRCGPSRCRGCCWRPCARPAGGGDRVGGTPEAVADGVTGLLVEREDAGGARPAIIELLLDPERRAQMGGAARERAREVFRRGPTRGRAARRLGGSRAGRPGCGA